MAKVSQKIAAGCVFIVALYNCVYRMLLNRGTALSQTDRSAKTVPRSVTGTTFEVIERSTGATYFVVGKYY